MAQEQDREDVAVKSQAWIASQADLDPDRVVFLDETWAKTNMTRTRGRSAKGSRLVEKTPCGRWSTTTFLGAVRSTPYSPIVARDAAGDFERTTVSRA